MISLDELVAKMKREVLLIVDVIPDDEYPHDRPFYPEPPAPHSICEVHLFKKEDDVLHVHSAYLTWADADCLAWVVAGTDTDYAAWFLSYLLQKDATYNAIKHLKPCLVPKLSYN